MSDLATRRSLAELVDRVSALEARTDTLEKRLDSLEPPVVVFGSAGDLEVETVRDVEAFVTFGFAGDLKAFAEAENVEASE